MARKIVEQSMLYIQIEQKHKKLRSQGKCGRDCPIFAVNGAVSRAIPFLLWLNVENICRF